MSKVPTRRLQKLLGNKAAWRVNPKAPDAAGRAAAAAVAEDLANDAKSALDAMNARREELLKADAAYQTLRADYDAAKKARDDNSGRRHWYPISVGTISGVAGMDFFHVKAEGDTWDEVIKKLESSKEGRNA